MKTDHLELYTDYLISNCGAATATGLSALKDNRLFAASIDDKCQERFILG